MGYILLVVAHAILASWLNCWCTVFNGLEKLQLFVFLCPLSSAQLLLMHMFIDATSLGLSFLKTEFRAVRAQYLCFIITVDDMLRKRCLIGLLMQWFAMKIYLISLLSKALLWKWLLILTVWASFFSLVTILVITLGKCPRILMRYSSCSWELLNIFICQTDGAHSEQGMGLWLVLVLPLQLTSHAILENMFNLWLN